MRRLFVRVFEDVVEAPHGKDLFRLFRLSIFFGFF